MAAFYLLPPRAEMARRWTDYLRQWFPGLDGPAEDLGEQVVAIVQQIPSASVVFADELPSDCDPRRELCSAFGADASDQVFDLRGGPMPSLADWAQGRFDIFATPAVTAS